MIKCFFQNIAEEMDMRNKGSNIVFNVCVCDDNDCFLNPIIIQEQFYQFSYKELLYFY